jgi:hypothetical protein
MTDRPSLLSKALEYHARGWALLPTMGKAPHPGLLRRTEGRASWKHLQSSPANEERLHAWFELRTKAGIGVITGEPSNLVVVDFDHGPFPPIGAKLPLTATVSSGRPNGVHLYYVGSANSRKHAGGEVRGNGSFVVAPPSLHSSGRRYRWRLSPKELEDSYSYSFAPFSEVVLEEVAAEESPHQPHLLPLELPLVLPLGTSLGRRLRHFNADEGAVTAMAAVLGITSRLGATFRCVLHPDTKPSATLCRAVDGVWLYHDWHARVRDEEWLPLPLVYARLRGRTGRVSPSELLRWQARLLIEAGVLSSAEPDLPRLPADASDAARQVYEGFRLLLGCKWLDEVGVPTTFSRRFAAAWCGVSVHDAQEGISWLEKHGHLVRVGEVDGRFRRKALLWLPGSACDKRSGRGTRARGNPVSALEAS